MKRIFACLITILVLFTTFFSVFPMGTASANSSYITQDLAGNIICEKREDVRINSEVLDIDLTPGNKKAIIRADYELENISNNEITVKTMFVLHAFHYYRDEMNKEYSVKKNGEPLSSEYRLMPFKSDNLWDIDSICGDWETAIFAASARTDLFGDGTGYYKYTVTISEESSVNFFAESGIICLTSCRQSYNETLGYILEPYKSSEIDFIAKSDSIDIQGDIDEIKIDGISDVYDFFCGQHFRVE